MLRRDQGRSDRLLIVSPPRAQGRCRPLIAAPVTRSATSLPLGFDLKNHAQKGGQPWVKRLVVEVVVFFLVVVAVIAVIAVVASVVVVVVVWDAA